MTSTDQNNDDHIDENNGTSEEIDQHIDALEAVIADPLMQSKNTMTNPKTKSAKQTRCGYITLAGPTNAGKSTLLNQLTGHKVAIVSRKVQTTRTRITAIRNYETDTLDTQLVFLDTPGLFKPQRRLDRAMIHAAETGMQEGDFIALLLDASKPEHAVLKDLETSLKSLEQNAQGKDIALILNKIDKISHAQLLSLTKAVADIHQDALDAVFMISARNGSGAQELLDYCAKKIPESPWMFVGDEITTLPFRLMAAEITREVIMDVIHQEIPYGLTVVTEHVEHFDNGDFKLLQNIIVEKKSQKYVVVGRAGRQIKEIGQRAREEMGRVFEGKIHLKLLVKVQENWQNDPEYYSLWNL
jgi:GTP-binding protein Era